MCRIGHPIDVNLKIFQGNPNTEIIKVMQCSSRKELAIIKPQHTSNWWDLLLQKPPSSTLAQIIFTQSNLKYQLKNVVVFTKLAETNFCVL